jgi:hypothetical protein
MIISLFFGQIIVRQEYIFSRSDYSSSRLQLFRGRSSSVKTTASQGQIILCQGYSFQGQMRVRQDYSFSRSDHSPSRLEPFFSVKKSVSRNFKTSQLSVMAA